MTRLDSSRGNGAELPIAGPRPERGDAAANRRRILSAARRIVTEDGAEALTMRAVSTAAGVGKGTVFRRFGDREGLIYALLDDDMRDFQDAFLHGPPPLGPGAAPGERLEAFIAALIEHQFEHPEFALAAETRARRAAAQVYGTLLIHLAALLHQIDPTVDERIIARLILNAIAPPVLDQARDELGVDTAAVQDAARMLIRGFTRATG